MAANQNRIPNYIEAPSREKLRAKMLETNARLGEFVQWFNIGRDEDEQGNKVWYAWFYETLGGAFQEDLGGIDG